MTYLLLLLVVPLVNGGRVIDTNNGPVRGISLKDNNVEAFLSIPFAEPPIGPLRFAKPVAKSPWKEIYDAKDLPPACIQSRIESFEYLTGSDVKMEEDCLYLNLWVPEGGSDSKTVMVWIHGGAFTFGSSNWKVYDGAGLAERGDVIVASMNYRVGTLGFFYGSTDKAPGNMGMHDQVMAIQWIKDNAKHFGGDPDNIVLFGESAGAFSVSLHMLSPLSKHLFKRSILQSGAAFNPSYSKGNKRLLKLSQMSANLLGCADDIEAMKSSPKDVIDCMKKIPAEKFSEVDKISMQKGRYFLPRVGDDFIAASPADLFRKGEFKDTEILLGITRNEGTLFLSMLKADILGMGGEKNDVSILNLNEESAKKIMRPLMMSDAGKKVIQSYLDRVKEETRYTYLDAVLDVIGDFTINCGALFQAEYQSMKNQQAYFYVFDYRSPSSPFPKWMGVAHFSEVPYVFGNPLVTPFTEFEEEFSKDVMDMWISFAKTGNPRIPGGLKWPQFSHKDPKYLIIGQRDRVGVRPDDYRCESWRKMYKSVIDDEVLQNFKSSDK